MPAHRMHEDEIEVRTETVVSLVVRQFPEWAHLPVERVTSSGTVNAIFRIGGSLAARFPLRRVDPASALSAVLAETSAARAFARCSPFPTPAPVALGEPGEGFPLPWSVQTWLPGESASALDPGASAGFAEDLASLVAALRSTGTGGARFDGAGRGGDLKNHDEWMARCFEESKSLLDVVPLQELWARFRCLPRSDADGMVHGDLNPGNLLTDGVRLLGVLDAGMFGPADPALDLIPAWSVLEDGPRAVFRERLGCDDLQWERGKAWTFEQAMGCVWYYARSNPTMSAMGRRALAGVVSDTPL